MYCPKCGEKCRENTKFCGKCGAPLTDGYADGSAQADDPESCEESQSLQQTGGESAETLAKKQKVLLGTVIAAAACAVVVGGGFALQNSHAGQVQDYLEAGYAFLEDGDYEEAMAAFSSAVAIDPKVAEEIPVEVIPEPEAVAVTDPFGTDGTDEGDLSVSDQNTSDSTASNSNRNHNSNNNSGDSTGGNSTDSNSGNSSNSGGSSNNSSNSGGSSNNSSNGGGSSKDTGNQDAGNQQNDQTTGKREGEDGEEVELARLNEEEVQEMLQTFSVPIVLLLEEWYDEDADQGFFELESLDAGQAYTIAALAVIESEREEIYSEDAVRFCCMDDVMVDVDELPEELAVAEEEEEDPELYVLLEDDTLYAQYLADLFGEEYALDDFEPYESRWGVVVRRDDEGQIFLKILEEEDEEETVEIEIWQSGPEPDEEGVYTVIVRFRRPDPVDQSAEETNADADGEEEAAYLNANVDGEEEAAYPETTDYYMRFLVALNEDSRFGCSLTRGMLPAGAGEFDPDYEADYETALTAEADTQTEPEE